MEKENEIKIIRKKLEKSLKFDFEQHGCNRTILELTENQTKELYKCVNIAMAFDILKEQLQIEKINDLERK